MAEDKVPATGARARCPGGVPAKLRGSLARDLKVIAKINYAHYFSTVADIVRYERGRGILSQGRGTAANSAFCY